MADRLRIGAELVLDGLVQRITDDGRVMVQLEDGYTLVIEQSAIPPGSVVDGTYEEDEPDIVYPSDIDWSSRDHRYLYGMADRCNAIADECELALLDKRRRDSRRFAHDAYGRLSYKADKHRDLARRLKMRAHAAKSGRLEPEDSSATTKPLQAPAPEAEEASRQPEPRRRYQ